MFKFLVVVLLFVIGAALYEQNQISLMSDDQKQMVLKEKEVEFQQRLEAKKAQDLIELAQAKKMKELSNTPWADVEPAQYAEKVLADKSYLWVLLLIVPTILFQLARSWDNAKRGH